MGLEGYAVDTTPFFAENDFYEIEVARRIDLFGNIAHVWSAYEARTALGAAEPERRGINSIQLFRDPELGWRIMAMIWDNEARGWPSGILTVGRLIRTATPHPPVCCATSWHAPTKGARLG